MFSFLKSKPLFKEILPSDYIDIHNHILPGIDDGAASIEDTDDLIAGMKELGISNAIATPHTFFGRWDNTAQSIHTAFEKQYTEEFVKEVKRQTKDERRYIITPHSVYVKYLNAKIYRIKYVCEQTKEVVDYEAIKRQALVEKKNLKQIPKMVQDLSIQIRKKGQENVETPKKMVTTKPQWLRTTATSRSEQIPLTEE